ncbi:MAG: hypothetical protein HYU51_08940 [Candidatus Rokubacteria bacterium]|nr:hypothetical protein [Candidatus Rokubacteria bacterium]
MSPSGAIVRRDAGADSAARLGIYSLPVLSRLSTALRAGARWPRLLAFLFAAVPPGLVVLEILGAGTRVPMEDHWDMVPLLDRDAAGTLAFRDLWAQHNEHRYLLPWLVMLGLARLTRWNILTELLLNVAVSLLALALLAGLVHRACRERAPALAPWLVLAASLMTFSLVKWENWLWGLSQPAFMSALAACATVSALAWRGPTITGAALSTLAAAAGALSFANGLVLLAVVPVGLALDPRGPWRQRSRLVVATVVASGAIAALYLAGLRHPAKHPSPWLVAGDPLGFAAYVLTYLGAPLGWPSAARSLAWGAIGAAALVAATAWLWSRVPAARPAVLPFMLLALYVAGSASMVGVGRLGMGVAQAVSSRYTTISSLLWVSVAVAVALAVAAALDAGRASRRVLLAVLAPVVLVLLAAAASYASAWNRAGRMTLALETSHRVALECVRFYRVAPDDCLRMSYHDPGVLRQRAERLEALGLGPFRSPAPLPLGAYVPAERATPAGAITHASAYPVVVRYVLGTLRTYRSTEIVLAGWAIDPATGGPPRGVLVATSGTVLGEAPVADERTGGRTGGQPRWSFRFGAFRLPPGARVLEAYAVLDGPRIVPLLGSPTLDAVPRD